MKAFIATVLIGSCAYLFHKYDIKSFVADTFNVSTKKDGDIFTLATINLTEADKNFDKISKDLVRIFQDVGFTYVTGVQGYCPDELLKWTKWFFDLKKADKDTVVKSPFHKDNANSFRGYFPLIPGGHSYKEVFEIGAFQQVKVLRRVAKKDEIRNLTRAPGGKLYMRNVVQENNVWPITENEEDDIKFQKFMQKYYKVYFDTSMLLFRMFIKGLGFDKNKFDHLFSGNTLSTYRLIHYPTRLRKFNELPDEAKDGNIAITTGEHSDTDILTLLTTFNNPGLQIKPPGYEKWLNVPPRYDHFVLNIGSLLSHMTDRKLIATNHRVIDIGTDRYSSALFFEPKFDADVSRTLFNGQNKFVGNITKYGHFMTNRASQFVEYSTTDFGIVD